MYEDLDEVKFMAIIQQLITHGLSLDAQEHVESSRRRRYDIWI